MSVTTLQAEMIKSIATSDFTEVNGDVPETLADIGWVWADCVIRNAQEKGVFTSLLNAGLVRHDGEKRDACVTLTETGFAAYKAL